MHIDKDMLPQSNRCEHSHVEWTITEPRGESYVLVTMHCKNCPAKIENVRMEKE